MWFDIETEGFSPEAYQPPMNGSKHKRQRAANVICLVDLLMLRDAYIQSCMIREDFESNFGTDEMRATATSIGGLFVRKDSPCAR